MINDGIPFQKYDALELSGKQIDEQLLSIDNGLYYDYNRILEL
jgi:hypothetical protein